MGEVVVMNVVQRSREDRVQRLWDLYLDARCKAEQSTDIADGIAAGKAWAAFLDAFRPVAS
jgi:hypothetical protein